MLQQIDNGIINNGAALPQTANNYSGGKGIPIPGKSGGKSTTAHHTSSGFFSDSDDSIGSNPDEESSPLSENIHMLSSSYHGGMSAGSNAPLNIYGTSPRTSVMFNYYASPKGSYRQPHPHLIRTRSTDTSVSPHSTTPHSTTPHSRSESMSLRDSSDNNINADNEKWRKSDLSKVPGKLLDHFQNLDLRPRAWSESDKNRNNASLQNSRKSALQKLKLKLGQKGSGKRLKSQDDGDEKNKSTVNTQGLEKVEEGRQLDCASPFRTRSQAISQDHTRPAVKGSIHQEHETRRKVERRVGVVRSPPQGLPLVNENPEDYLIYQRFLEEHTCYDLMPTSSKLVVLDTRLEVRKAFHALIENSLRCAPLWDSEMQDYVGLLTVSDFVSILLAYHKCPTKKLEDLENQKISCWRNVLNSRKTLIHCAPQASLFDALCLLTGQNIRRLAIVHPDNGDIFHVINHRRILQFLHLFMNELPKPKYMVMPVRDLGFGSCAEVATVNEDSPVIDALKLLDQYKFSGLPVVDSQGRVTDVFTKTDVLVLAGEQLFYDLSIKVKSVISLHSLAEPDDGRPSLTRMMPGSPALSRRRFPSGQDHPPGSALVKAHPFLRDSDNTPRLMPSPLATSSVSSNQKKHSENRKSKEKNHHHHNTTPPMIRTSGAKDSLAKGDTNPQIFLHRRRHLSSNLSKSTSISSHLVTVTIDDTLECVVNSVVAADALQAVIVDDFDHVKGVISIGDILRFMVYPTDKEGKILKEEVAENPPPVRRTSSGNRLNVTGKSGNRLRAASDDTDLTSSLVRKQSGNLSNSTSGAVGPISSTPPDRVPPLTAQVTSFSCDNTADNSPDVQPLLKDEENSAKPPFARRPKSGEKIDRL